MCGEKLPKKARTGLRPGSPPHVRGKGIKQRNGRVAVRITPACAGKRHKAAKWTGRCEDHPRMCGEKSCCPVLEVHAEWITPACAGKRSCRCSRWPQPWDHPRMCGEKMPNTYTAFMGEGSPPHVRGKGPRPGKPGPGKWITPACAGKRKPTLLPPACVWDHPRMCGEKPQGFAPELRRWGSPPHMRGKDAERFRMVSEPGITPAHAGKSPLAIVTPCSEWDHPRTCGEKAGAVRSSRKEVGSPPHMRGKVPAAYFSGKGYRITPAHAGKSNNVLLRIIVQRDHPRTCGEKGSLVFGWFAPLGSPPHMRGKGALSPLASFLARITPAHAGKRVPPIHGPSGPGDHPRTCGEKTQHLVMQRNGSGSPPHMRGKGRRFNAVCRWSRITPAHAGKRAVHPELRPMIWDHPRTCGEKSPTRATESGL